LFFFINFQKTPGALTLHEKRHTGIKPYICQFDGCGKAFVEGSNLTRHMNTHTKEKNHICPSCGRGFGRLFLLEIHLRTHTGLYYFFFISKEKK
jgi:uncharacterized Zn-finger protein